MINAGRTKHKNVQGITPASIEKNEKAAKEFLGRLADRMTTAQDWLYGSKATALDAHVVCFIARMQDVKRDYLVPQVLKDYAAWAMGQDAWKGVMQGRGTMLPE
jgi:glutathione S-transferase